jgi:hypothetical protein
MALRLTPLDELAEGYSIFFVAACTYHRKDLLNTGTIHLAFRFFAKKARARNVFAGRDFLMPVGGHRPPLHG